MLLGLALVWSKELVRGRSGRPLNCGLLMAAEPRRQSVARVVTVDIHLLRGMPNGIYPLNSTDPNSWDESPGRVDEMASWRKHESNGLFR